MRSYCFVRWRLLRPLVVLVLCSSLLASYIYLKSRPSYTLYKGLVEQEIEDSRQFIKENRNAKYVSFKQLRGAGFNNQVGSTHELLCVLTHVYRRRRFCCFII